VPRRRLEVCVVDKIREYFESQFSDQVSILGTRIALWKRQFRELHEKLPKIYLQPDIDILWSASNANFPQLNGVEVKVINLTTRATVNSSYYEGLEEALGLLRFGLDTASLFQVFLIPGEPEWERDLVIQRFVPYQLSMTKMINTLRLPIGYRAAFDIMINGNLTDEAIKVLDVSNTQVSVQPQGNPFLTARDEHCLIIREAILNRYQKKNTQQSLPLEDR